MAALVAAFLVACPSRRGHGRRPGYGRRAGRIFRHARRRRPLRRDANGNIEVIDPTKEQGTGKRLCDAKAICVGPGQAYTRISDALKAARDGDTIEIVGGTYNDTGAIRRRMSRCAASPADRISIAPASAPPQDKACILLLGQNDVLENLEISGAQMSERLGANGACISNGHDVSFTLRQSHLPRLAGRHSQRRRHDRHRGIRNSTATA